MGVSPNYTDDYNYDEEYTFYNYQKKFKLGYTQLHKFLYGLLEEGWKEQTYETHSQYMNEMGDDVIINSNNYIIDNNKIQIIEVNNDKFDNYGHFIKTILILVFVRTIFHILMV